MNPIQLRTLIVDPTLKALKMWSPEASDLMMGTCAQETNLGEFLKQVDGVALGIYQLERMPHDDIWLKTLPNLPNISNLLMVYCRFFVRPLYEQVMHDLFYATAMTRIFYYRIPYEIPKSLEGQANYYKQWYNTSLGKATPEQYIANYNKYVLGAANGIATKPKSNKVTTASSLVSAS